MKLFGAKRAEAGDSGMFGTRWFRALVTFCSVLVVVAVCVEVYRRAANYGTKVVEAHPIDARIVIKNPPAWLHRDIVNQLLKQAYDLAQRDEATYNRSRNVLDSGILREFADLYTGKQVVDGKEVSRQTVGFNAWVRRISAVRRNVAKDNSSQTIEIEAEWRSAAAWVRAGEMLYLIDSDGTRLPGDYPLSDRSSSKLMVITGIDMPEVNGKAAVPLPGEKWVAGKGDRIGDDLAAGLAMIETLKGEQFAPQIDAVNMTNFKGRRDPVGPWIVLDTIWKTADGTPRVIHWGRPVGQEKYYEVQAAAKVKVLNDIYLRFNRIDAGRDYVDIRTELVRLPKQGTQAETIAPMVRG